MVTQKISKLLLPDWVMITLVWGVWRAALFFLGWVADHFLPYQPSFPYFNSLLPLFGWPRWLYSWANFDGVHYLGIADKGYFGTGLIQAFFPLTPILMAAVHRLTTLDLLLSGLLLNQIGSLVVCLLLWQWLKTELGKNAAHWGLAWWLLFPTAFFTVAVYSESTFLALSLGCWLAAKKSNWWLAGVLAALASATRIVGVWLVVLLFFELLAQTRYRYSTNWAMTKKWLNQSWLKLIAIALGVVGLGSYMVYLWWQFGDPLFFLHLQSAFGAGRQTNLVLWPQVVWRGFHILLTARPFDWKYLAYVEEFVVGVGSVLVLAWGWWQRKTTHLSTPLALYALGCVLMPTVTGTFSSLPRYVLAAWPLWLVLIAWSRTSRWAWLGVLFSLGLLIINTILFIQGYWVA